MVAALRVQVWLAGAWIDAGTLSLAAPDWVAVARHVCAGVCDPARLLDRLRRAEAFIRDLPRIARDHAIAEEVIAGAMRRHVVVADTLAAIPGRA